MPDLPECNHSPFLHEPDRRGAALITGHKRYCDLINPGHPDYNPAIAEDYARMSYIFMATESPEDEMIAAHLGRLESQREARLNQRRPTRPPAPVPVAAQSIRMHPDENVHRTIYESATGCAFRLESKSCCSADKCGTGGRHEGESINMGVCYPCKAETMGIALD